MGAISVRYVVAVAMAGLVTFVAAAADLPPLKPGLWEVTMVRTDGNGKPIGGMERMQASMQHMSPEVRERMQAMMKSRGMDLSNGALKTCMTKESFAQGRFEAMAAATGCTTTFSTRTQTLWKWHSSCAKLKAESDGETVFSSPESYTVKSTNTSSLTGKRTTTTMTGTGKWLGANCGDIKPMGDVMADAPAKRRAP